MFRISNSIRKSAGIRSPTTKLIRGNHDVSTGGSNIFINKGGSREAYRPKFTSNTSVYNAAGKEAHWRHLSSTGTATSTRTARPLGTPCGLMATSLAIISLTTTPENEPTKCAKDDKRSDPRLPKKKSSTAKAKPKTQQKTGTAAPQRTLLSAWLKSSGEGLMRGAEGLVSRARGTSSSTGQEALAPATPARDKNGTTKRGARDIATTPIYDNKNINQKKMARENESQGEHGVGADKAAAKRSSARSRTAKGVDSVATAIQLDGKKPRRTAPTPRQRARPV